MSKSISVKVKVSTLISSLDKALAERSQRFANQEKEEARFEKEKEAYNLAILKLVKSKGVITDASRQRWYHGSGNSKSKTVEFSVTMELPKTALPTEPVQIETYPEHRYERETDEIKQAIRVLKMTDQEYVNASTLKSVSEYL
jgi:hypothetical protein